LKLSEATGMMTQRQDQRERQARGREVNRQVPDAFQQEEEVDLLTSPEWKAVEGRGHSWGSKK
jgi:hypothetical protein